MNDCCQLCFVSAVFRVSCLLCVIIAVKMSSKMYSKRGAELKVIDGFKLRFHKFLANDVERWVCTQKMCKAFLKVQSGQTMESDLRHNHQEMLKIN